MMTFRSGAAGYCDLTVAGGTGNFGGFKSGCTSSLIPADGVLNAPDYTRTCICAYPNQTSLALVHMPDVEIWTFNVLPAPRHLPVRRAGLNLGAPGDRLHNGTLWLDCPSVGGPSPDLAVDLLPSEKATVRDRKGRARSVTRFAGRLYRHHASVIKAGELPWVGASGAEGLTALRVVLAPDGGRETPFTARLVFAEPDPRAAEGSRVFDVALQGRVVRTNYDVVRAAGGPRRTAVLEVTGVPVAEHLAVTLTPKRGKPLLCGLELVAE
jgi:hypothetical protein